MADTDDIDERARLEAIVYGRSTATDAERAAATAALRSLIEPVTVLAAEREVVPPAAERSAPSEATPAWVPRDEVPGPRRRTRALTGILSGVALVAAIAVTPTPAPFADSLRVFERPQSPADAVAAVEHPNLPGAGPDVDVSTVRLVAEPAAGVVVLAYRTVGADVCLAIMVDGGGGGSCVAESDFRRAGLSGGTLFPPSGWRYAWGPLGDPVISGP